MGFPQSRWACRQFRVLLNLLAAAILVNGISLQPAEAKPWFTEKLEHRVVPGCFSHSASREEVSEIEKLLLGLGVAVRFNKKRDGQWTAIGRAQDLDRFEELLSEGPSYSPPRIMLDLKSVRLSRHIALGTRRKRTRKWARVEEYLCGEKIRRYRAPVRLWFESYGNER